MGRRNGGMRNLSMKKFGTPIAAGPGSAGVKVGFAGVGVPSARCSGPVGSAATGVAAAGSVAGVSAFWRRVHPRPAVEADEVTTPMSRPVPVQATPVVAFGAAVGRERPAGTPMTSRFAGRGDDVGEGTGEGELDGAGESAVAAGAGAVAGGMALAAA